MAKQQDRILWQWEFQPFVILLQVLFFLQFYRRYRFWYQHFRLNRLWEINFCGFPQKYQLLLFLHNSFCTFVMLHYFISALLQYCMVGFLHFCEVALLDFCSVTPSPPSHFVRWRDNDEGREGPNVTSSALPFFWHMPLKRLIF